MMISFSLSLAAQETVTYNLSGTDKDHTVDWDFFCSKGAKSGSWMKIAVPSNWEQQGFGGYTYGNGYTNKAAGRTDEKGTYRHSFIASPAWKNKHVFIVFEGVMTDTEVKINGKSAGDMHQGGFYQFRYEIGSLLNYSDSNRLEVNVSKESANKSVNKAEREGDFWALGGIFRPVYLEILPETYLSKPAIDAKADGKMNVRVLLTNSSKGDRVTAQVQELNGKNIGRSFSADATDGALHLEQSVTGIKQWNPESPDLYQLVLTVTRNGKSIHSIIKKFGFRTTELRIADGFYVNGVKVLFKGVDRHSFWPESGRTLSKALSIMDVSLMKEMNMNAVRMSHYPPDQHFLDVCDSLGMFVLDELTGWQAAYDTVAGRKLVKELVERDVNHPCIVMWANGNEGGFNRGLDNDYKIYDIQERIVYHPWEKFNGTDTKHYPDYSYLVNSGLYSREIFFPTEFMHGLYDGGHAAGLNDFWNNIIRTPNHAGGFLWDFSDAGLKRMDRNGELDTDGNHGADGILGPHREKEASYYGIKEIWSPVYISNKSIPTGFDGRLNVENRYLYTNLDKCKFSWKLVSFPSPAKSTIATTVDAQGNSPVFKLSPGERAPLSLNLPATWNNSDALYVTATDQTGKEIFTWSWPISSSKKIADKSLVKKKSGAAVLATETADELVIKNARLEIHFTKSTGFIDKVISDNSTISLSGGPFMLSTPLTLKTFTHRAEGNSQIVEAGYSGNGSMSAVWTFSPGLPVKLNYSYQTRGDADFIGIGINYPEEKITGVKWLGRGPYRVWKNRMQGMQFGVFEKKYNNTITGESWEYPEFKGYHANMNWVTIENKEKPFTIFSENEGVFLQLLKPEKPKGAGNDNTSPPFPASSLGFMYAIPPIGTKFQNAERLGPESQKNAQLNNGGVAGVLWFEF